MILTFVTLTDDITKVPVWEVQERAATKNVSCFIQTPEFPKRILLLGPNASPSYAASEPVEACPGIFVSKMELPYEDFYVTGDDLKPFIGGFDPDITNKNVVVIQIDRSVYTYLYAGVGPSNKEGSNAGSVIVNTFHAKDWVGCIAVLGEEFERGNNNPPRMVGMYIDYAINGSPRAKMLHEMHIKGNPRGISISDGLVEGDIAGRLFKTYQENKKQSFRIKTIQRLSNIVIVPEGTTDVKEFFEESPADYIRNPYDIQYISVPVDENGVVDETVEYVKREVLPMFKESKGNRTKSAIFYNCKPSESFFHANLSYLFVANMSKKKKKVSYYSLICP